jgi:hypothetical protein
VERLPLGSKEYLVVDVTDRLTNLTSLDGVPLTFSVTDNEGAPKITNQSASNLGMKAYCLIDTNLPALWTPDEYRLTLKLSVGSEVPVLGPFAFKVA